MSCLKLSQSIAWYRCFCFPIEHLLINTTQLPQPHCNFKHEEFWGVTNYGAVLSYLSLPPQSYTPLLTLWLPLHCSRQCWTLTAPLVEQQWGTRAENGSLQVRDSTSSVHWTAGVTLSCAWRVWGSLERCVGGRQLGWLVLLFPGSR